MMIFKPVCLISVLFLLAIFLLSCGGKSTPVDPPNGTPDPLPNDPPVAQLTYNPVLRTFAQGDQVMFDGSSSIDPDDNIVTYEWDFNYNDADFTVDAVGPSLNYSLPSFGSVIAALRVTDAGDTPLSDITRTRLNVTPSGVISDITNGNVEDFMLRRAVESGGDFYALYTGSVSGQLGAYVQRSSDDGSTWGEPVIISDNADDLAPWGVWMDSAPFGIVVGWMAASGEIKFSSGEPSGTNSIAFAAPSVLGVTGVVYNKGFVPEPPVVYSVACSPDGAYAYVLYMTTASYSLYMYCINLDNGAVVNSTDVLIKSDSAIRFVLSGAGLGAGPQGRAYVAYIWKSLGYDNADMIELYYLDPPSFDLQGPVRVDNGLDGFIYDHDPYIVVNGSNEPIVYFRTTGLYNGGKDVALCFSDGDPPVFAPTIRGNNNLGDDPLAAQNSPSAVFDTDSGNLWLAFEDFRDVKSVSEIYLAMFDDQQSTILPDFNISNDPALIYSDINPQICFKEGDNPSIVVIWERNGTDIVAYHASY